MENTVDGTLQACVCAHTVQDGGAFGEPLYEQRVATLPKYAPDSDKSAFHTII